MAVPLMADLVPVGPLPFSGTGLGTVNTILTIADEPRESGCVGRGLTADIIGPAACPPGHPLITGGDEKTGASQSLTRIIGAGTTADEGLNLTNAASLRIVLNLNENEFNPVIVEDMVLTIYSPTGTVLFTSGTTFVPVIDLYGQSGTGSAGYAFQLNAVQAAQAQAFFAPTNRVGLAATLSDTTAGNETFFIANVAQIGVVATPTDLAVTKTAAATVIAGNQITYTSTVRNLGTEPATTVTFTDVLPANTRFVSLTAPAGWTCTSPAAGAAGTLTCTTPTLAAGGAATFTYAVRSCPDTACAVVIANSASVNSATFDPTPANNTATATTTTQAQSNVAITKTGTSAAPTGAQTTFVINYSNAGPSNSVNTVVTDTLPAGFVATSVTAPNATCTGVGTGTVTCNVGTLGAANQCAVPTAPTSGVITITATAAATAGTFTNTATITSGNCLADANVANNTATLAVALTTAAIPTLNEWGLIASALLLLGFGLLRLRA